MVNFEIVGKLKAIKDKDNFHPYEEKVFEKSGWQNVRYRFNVVSGTNRFMCEISGGKWVDDSKNKIVTMSRATDSKKSESMEVKWDERRNPDIIDKVAGYRIYTCNLLDFNEQKEADDETKKKKEHRFIERTEYAKLVKKVIDSGKYADAKFKIQGQMDFQYSAKDDRYYRTMTVNKIYKVTPETEDRAEMTIDAYYMADSIDDNLFNCYTDYYFNNIKARRFVNMPLVFHSNGTEDGDKVMAAFKKKLSKFEEEPVRKVQLVCTMIDGAERVDVKLEDLDEEIQENVMLGLISEKDAIASVGGQMFGERKTENRILKFSRNSAKGSEPTVFTEEDLFKKPVPDPIEEDEENIDLFADDDDI